MFSGCTSLTNVTIPNSVTTIGNDAFRGCKGLISITIPDGVTAIGNSAFQHCSNLTSITIPDSVTTIGDSAFSDCNNLTNITISDSITTIGVKVFANCSHLANAVIPDGVTSIAESMFSGCDRLTSVTIPDSVTTIGDEAFRVCANLASITITDSVTAIGNSAFFYCIRLTNITIPDSVTTIGDSAFSYCSKLTDVYYTGTQEQWDTLTINNDISDLIEATIHYGSCPTAHRNTVDVAKQDSTCTEIGYTAGQYCSDCEKWVISHEVIPVLGHSYASSYTIDREATCTTEGSKSRHCTRTDCTAMTDVTVIEKVSHTYKTIITQATSGKNGSIIKKCTVCGNVASNKVIQYVKTFSLSTTSYTYDGEVKTPTVTVKDAAGKKLTADTDYAVTYASGRKNLGSYTVTITMKGNYSGTKTLSFKINLITPTVKAANVSTGVKVTWNKISGAKTYTVYRSVYSDGAWSSWTAIKTGCTGTAYTDTTVKSNTNVRYAVSAINGKYQSAYVSSSSITFLERPNVTAKNTVSSGFVKLSWEKINGAERYYVYRATSKDGKYTRIASTTKTAYTDSDATVGKTYCYKVKAIRSTVSSSSSYSSPDKGVRDLQQPNVTVKLSNGDPKLSWAKISSAEKYYIYRATFKDGEYERIKSTTTTSYTDTSVKAGKMYYYKVKAIHSNSAANSAYSAVDKIQTK